MNTKLRPVPFSILFFILFILTNTLLAQSVSFVGSIDENVPPPDSGSGVRMMWYPEKAAFRAGHVDGSQWNQNNIGFRSVAMGSSSIASGDGAVAIGTFNRALGIGSFASGNSNSSIQAASFTTNSFNKAKGLNSSSFGSSNESVGTLSSVFGQFNYATAFATFVIGQNNDTTHISKTTWNVNDPVFIIGNGSSNQNRSNAFTVFKNGNATISGTLTANQNVNVGGALTTDLVNINGVLTANQNVNIIGPLTASQVNINGVLTANQDVNVTGTLTASQNATVGGALNFANTNIAVISDDQTITIVNNGYIRINSNNITAANRTVLLSNGTNIGQILILESSSPGTFKWQLEDSGNLNLSATHDFGRGDTIQLIWNGTEWLEIHFSDN